LKRVVRALVEERRLDEVAALAETNTRVLGLLVPLTFDPDTRVAWRAVEAMGVAAERVAGADPGAVREHLRRLFWLLSEESGGICWRAPEAMAEIVSRCPELFGDYVPVIVHLIAETAEEDLAHFRRGMIWAIGRLGPLARQDASDVLESVTSALEDSDAQVRGVAVWCLGRLGRVAELAVRPDLAHDQGTVEVYEEGEVLRTRVGRLYERALEGAVPEEPSAATR